VRCAELAMDARSPELAMMLTNLSKDWMKLATDLERTQALMKEFPPLIERSRSSVGPPRLDTSLRGMALHQDGSSAKEKSN
jgi:hypothetical protein